MTSSIYNQQGFRFYQDDGSWSVLGDENADITHDTDGNFILRVEIEETNNKGALNKSFALYRSLNAGAYAEVASTDTYVVPSLSANFADGDTDIERLTTSARTFTNAELDENGVAGDGGLFDFDGGDKMEAAWCLALQTGALADSDVLTLEVRESDGTQLGGYTRRPNLTYEYTPVTHASTASLSASASVSASATVTSAPGAYGAFVKAPKIVDFEENDLSDMDHSYASGAASVGASSDQAYGGSYSMSAIINGDEYCYASKEISWPSSDTLYSRFYWYADQLGPYVADDDAIRIGNLGQATSIGSSDNYWQLRLNPGATKLTLYAADSNGVKQATGLSYIFEPSSWLEIEILYDISSSDASAELFVDGDSQGSWTGTGLYGAMSAYHLSLGVYQQTHDSDVWAHAFFDNIQAQDTRIGASGPTTHTGTASLSGSATLSAHASPSWSGEASLSGSASITANGRVVNAASASLSGTASLSATGAQVKTASASLSGTAVLSATGNTAADRNGTASLSGTASLTAHASPNWSGDASLSSICTLTASGRVVNAVSASMSGSATLAATGRIVNAASASLSGTATLSATGGAVRPASASLSGTATVSATGATKAPNAGKASLSASAALSAHASPTWAGEASLSGTVTVSAAGTLVGTATGTASLSASATMTAHASPYWSGQVTVTGNATIGASGRLVHSASAGLNASALVSAVARKLTTHEAKAALTALAIMAAVGTRIPKASVGGAAPRRKPPRRLPPKPEDLWEKRLLVDDEEWVVLEHG